MLGWTVEPGGIAHRSVSMRIIDRGGRDRAAAR
jgi:hypothetical protein